MLLSFAYGVIWFLIITHIQRGTVRGPYRAERALPVSLFACFHYRRSSGSDFIRSIRTPVFKMRTSDTWNTCPALYTFPDLNTKSSIIKKRKKEACQKQTS